MGADGDARHDEMLSPLIVRKVRAARRGQGATPLCSFRKKLRVGI
jgi:hypothetical protein